MATASATSQTPVVDVNDGYGSKGYRGFVLGSLLLVYIFNFIDRSILGILTEPIKTSLQLEDWHMGVVGGFAFAMLYTTLGIPIARVSERTNRTMIIVVALLLWSLMTVLCGFATGFLTLFLIRVGVGIGEAGCTPPAQSLIADYFKPSSRATAVSIYALGVPLGGMIAGLAGGPINDYVTGENVYNILNSWGWTWIANMIDWQSLEGWRIAFFAVGFPGVVFAFILAFLIKEPPRGYTDPPEAVKQEQASFGEVLKILSKKPTYIHVVIGAGIASFVGYGVAQFTTSFLRRTHGLSLSEAALLFSLIIGVMAAIGVFSSGWLADKMSKRHPRALSWLPAFGMAVSVPLYAMGFLAPTVILAMPPLMAAALLHYFYLGPMYAVSGGVVDSRMRATSVAITLFVVNIIGLGLGPTMIGFLSTFLKTIFLSGADLGLTLNDCKPLLALDEAGVSALSGAEATNLAACLSADARGLQWSIILFCCLYGWAALHYLLAGKTLQRDMIGRQG
ncbi:MFS transporter [Henriciella sp.]|uniref:spinster family MFS transporter n=1 Tax=Henriciella sp. TaxID=1968823 RepID=UPI00261AA59F|nr:MFS transporter [Henriciella sp.]